MWNVVWTYVKNKCTSLLTIWAADGADMTSVDQFILDTKYFIAQDTQGEIKSYSAVTSTKGLPNAFYTQPPGRPV